MICSSRVGRVGTGIMALALLATGCSSNGGESGGEEITVALANHVWTDEVKELIPEFEQETGIKVNVTTYGEQQLSDLYNVSLNAGSDDLDVLMYRTPQEGLKFAKNAWLEPLSDRVTENAEWNWDDFQSGYRDAVSTDGVVYGVPIVTDRGVLYYRTDLLAEAGLEIPTDLASFAEVVAQVHNPDEGVFGFVGRGQKAAAVSTFATFLYSMGGDWDDGENATLDTPEAKAAYELYAGLLRDYGPPGATNMGWPEVSALFQQGKAAFVFEADSIYKTFTDPSESTVADEVGFARLPAGPAGSRTFAVATWALAINSSSSEKDASWKFIEWITSEEKVLATQSAGVPGARESVWNTDEGTAGFPEQLAQAMQESGENGVGYYLPRVLDVSEARDIVGFPIVAGVEGDDVDAAIAKAQKDYQALLDRQ